MSLKKVTFLLLSFLGLTAFLAQAAPAVASQTEKAAWKITSTSQPTNFAPGSAGEIFLVASNIGAKASEGVITITDEVPAGLEITGLAARKNDLGAPGPECKASGQKVTCTIAANQASGSGDIAVGSKNVTGLITTVGTFAVGREIQGTGIPAGTTIVSQSATELTLSNAATLTAAGVALATPGSIRPGYHFEVSIEVKAPLAPEVATNEATITGGGSADAGTTSAVIVSPEAADFGFLPGTVGLDALFTDPDGAATTQAGSHPYQLTADAGFPTKTSGTFTVSAGHLHDTAIDFPPGVIINPAATPELCTEAELVADSKCPLASQVGILNVLTKPAVTQAGAAPLYNMVPPPGEAAVLGAETLGVGIFVHFLGELRSDSDYGITGFVSEIPALPTHPAFGASVELWGNPTSALHDGSRGPCAPPFQGVATCALEAGQRADLALLTMPGRCPAGPLHFGARAHSWEELGDPAATASYEGADLAGAPSQIQGCGALDFEPALALRPTTNLADSPSGLDAELSQPQDFSFAANSPSPLRDALVTLPAGLTANASQADGLEVCSSAQIGMLTGAGQSPVHLSKQPAACPEASKLGTVEVESPLLAQIDEEDNVVYDPQGDPVPRPVHGSLFLAKPFDNPFNSLLALYIAVEDPRSGVIAKFAGKVEPDPVTGQLSTRFSENPQLPLQAIRLHLFAGSRAPLQTPLACGSYSTSTSLTPWAAPDLPDAHPTDSFEVSASPGGGACPASEAAAPNAPAFSAGTLAPRRAPSARWC